MSDKKNEELKIETTDEFDSVEIVEEVVVSDKSDKPNADVEAPISGGISLEEDTIPDAVTIDSEIDSPLTVDSAGAVAQSEDNDVIEELTGEDFDEFDDLQEELVATPPSSANSRSSGGMGKVVVGALALLIAGAGGYYFLSGSNDSAAPLPTPSVQQVEQQLSVSPSVSDNVVNPVVVDNVTSPSVDNEGAFDELNFSDEEVAIDDDVAAPASIDPIIDEISAVEDSMDVSFDDAPAVDTSDVSGADVAPVDEVSNDELLLDTAPEISSESDVIDVMSEAVGDSDVAVSVEEDVPASDIEDVSIAPTEETLEFPDQLEIVDDAIEPEMFRADEVQDAAPVEDTIDPDFYFDSVQKVATRDASLQSTGPVEVDPVAEPASRYLVVTDMKPKDSIESQVQQAKRALKLGRYDSALDIYERLYQKNPRDKAILMGRAVALQKTGRDTAAISAYEELLAIDSNNANALVNMLGLVKGQYPAVALQKLLSIRQAHPENAGVAAQIGLTYAAMNNTNDAKRYMNIAMGLEPNNALHVYNIAVVFDREGNRSKAVEYYEKALRVDAVHGGGRSVNRDVIHDRLAQLR